jgi:pyruvate kinase
VNVNKRLKTLDEMFLMASKMLKDLGLAKKGEKFVIVAGSPIGVRGKTNLLKVHTVI